MGSDTGSVSLEGSVLTSHTHSGKATGDGAVGRWPCVSPESRPQNEPYLPGALVLDVHPPDCEEYTSGFQPLGHGTLPWWPGQTTGVNVKGSKFWHCLLKRWPFFH